MSNGKTQFKVFSLLAFGNTSLDICLFRSLHPADKVHVRGECQLFSYFLLKNGLNVSISLLLLLTV